MNIIEHANRRIFLPDALLAEGVTYYGLTPHVWVYAAWIAGHDAEQPQIIKAMRFLLAMSGSTAALLDGCDGLTDYHWMVAWERLAKAWPILAGSDAALARRQYETYR